MIRSSQVWILYLYRTLYQNRSDVLCESYGLSEALRDVYGYAYPIHSTTNFKKSASKREFTVNRVTCITLVAHHPYASLVFFEEGFQLPFMRFSFLSDVMRDLCKLIYRIVSSCNARIIFYAPPRNNFVSDFLFMNLIYQAIESPLSSFSLVQDTFSFISAEDANWNDRLINKGA